LVKIRSAPTRELLERNEYGVLSTCDSDGQAYGIPLSYCVIKDSIYFHCAVAGHKLENIAANSRVSFCVVGKTEVLSDQFVTHYQSVIVFGQAEEVFDEEKHLAIEGVLAKYSPGYREKGLRYIVAEGGRARVSRVDIAKISGRARR
jgi:nitroimidazol reductase NimA-like FMN-containing flavoprotein (pyridoxamine 5'-phosphate oxidase superfamily)